MGQMGPICAKFGHIGQNYTNMDKQDQKGQNQSKQYLLSLIHYLLAFNLYPLSFIPYPIALIR